MSLTSTGFIRDTIDTIIARRAGQYTQVIPYISLDPANILYQWLKVDSLGELFLQTLFEQGLVNMTKIAASGTFLEYHGINDGMPRKSATKSYGYVECLGTINGYSIPVGSKFSTDEGISFTSYEAVNFDRYWRMTRQSGLYDPIPSTYSTVTGYKLFYDPTLTSEIPTGTYGYSFISGFVLWTTGIAYGTPYYYQPTGYLTISVPVQCDTAGIIGNIGANSIINNDSNIAYVEQVYNRRAITNGIDRETDTDYRIRQLQISNTTFSLEKISNIVRGIDGVSECKTYQNIGTDRTILTDWNDTANCTGIDRQLMLINTGIYSITFYPSGQVGTLQGLTLYGKATGTAPAINVWMTYHSSGQFETGEINKIAQCTFDRGVLTRGSENVFQDIDVPLKFNGLDSTKTYGIYFQQAEDTTTGNTWIFCLTGEQTIGNYRLDFLSGGVSYNNGSGLVYKTKYGLPGYTVSVVPEEGWNFTDLQADIESRLDYIDGEGYGPICIQSIVAEATKVYLSLTVTVSLEDGYELTTVQDNITDNITAYLVTLQPGDDIIYSKIEKIVLNTDGVYKAKGLQLNLNGGDWISDNNDVDLYVDDNEYVRLDTLGLYNGISIAKW